jgi:hypothetical protein
VTTFVTRGQLRMRSPNAARLTPRSAIVVGITVHTTGGKTTDPRATWANIQAAEMDGKLPPGVHYGDIAYNVGVTNSGDVLEGRNASWVGAHALSHDNVANRTTLGLAVVGDGTTLSDAARTAIRACGFLFRAHYGRPPLWLTHRHWNSPDGSHTQCPGDPISSFVAVLAGGH